MTDDTVDPNWDIIWGGTTLSKKTDKVEDAFKQIRDQASDSQADFDFGVDDFSWM
ncbi:MAG: hypothetical protein AAGI06_13825 [Pseudomonadota bacterium]